MMPSLKTQIHWYTRVQQLLIGIVLLTAILFYSLAFHPQSSKSQYLNGQINQKERELDANEKEARALPRVQADINHLLTKLADFKKLPASAGDLGQFQTEIAELARRDNLGGWSVSWPGTPLRHERFNELPVSVKFNGDFRNVFAFLCQLEDLPRLTRIKSMIVKSDNADGIVQVELLMNIYYSEG
jgi:Tfp pilus assembly protein PilO